jgi:Spherulation-specific family 4
MVGGYVATGYSGRSTGEVEDELSRYYEWYDIDRIFLDQQSVSTDQVGYYEELYEYVKDQSGSSRIVVTNAGAPVPQAYIDIAEIIIVYENSALPGDVLQDWMKDYNKSHFGILPYGTSVSESQYDDLHEQVGYYVYAASDASWMEVKGSVIDEQADWAGD